ncbi:unnamed protein product [Prunus armeniaca]
MVGSLGKLYESVENISYTYLQPNLKKDTLLKPRAAVAGSSILLLLTNEVDSNAKQFYICTNCVRRIFDVSGTVCPNYRYAMSTQVAYVCPQASSTVVATSGEGGYVKGV